MWQANYIIVDDIFSGFASNHEDVMTRSDLYFKLLNEDIDRQNVKLAFGQGVHEHDIRSMVESLSKQSASFSYASDTQLVKASKQNTHKHFSQNILVSIARESAENIYEMDLLLDGANEFFNDHMTGQHVQGMALIEASRQAFLSVTEQFYLAGDDREFYFVINNIHIDYLQFLFPLRSTIKYTILEEKIKGDRLSFNVAVDIIQAGKVCATTHIRFTAFEKMTIVGKEQGIANKVISAVHQQHAVENAINKAA